MIEDMLWACAVILACLLFYHYVLPALKRFDQRNVARIHQQDRDQADANAHFRHALDVAGEQVEEVQEIKVAGGTHYLFEAQVFSTRDEAEEMRASRVGVARRFYEELPTALSSRSESRSPLSARERASKRWTRH
jgi:hypothetical protein